MPFFDHRDSNGSYQLYYETSGTGPLLLLLHNGFYSSQTWRGIIPQLQSKFCCVAWDRLGYGQSVTEATVNASLTSGSSELDSLLRHLKLQGIDTSNLHLWGHCMGGAIAVDWIADHPGRALSLTLEACGFFSDADILRRVDMVARPWERLPRPLRQILETMHGSQRAPLVWSFIVNHTGSYVMDPDYDLRPKLSQLDCPVLVANGDHDLYFSRDHAQQGAEYIPQVSLWLRDDCGHDIHLEMGNEITAKVIEFAGFDSQRRR